MRLRSKSIFAVVLAAIFMFTFAQTSMATNYKVTTLSTWGPYQTGSGGEFTLQPNDDLMWVLNYYSDKAKNFGEDNTFQSFCLERNEYIYQKATYDAKINPYAANGGQGGATDNKDNISIGTAWLYSQFVKGNLTGYDYTDSGRKTSAGLLQNAFWWLEEEGVAYSDSNTFMLAAFNMYSNEAGARADSNGAFGIKVLNLTRDTDTNTGILRQDMLVATPIPAPILLLGAGLAGLVGLRKRAKK